MLKQFLIFKKDELDKPITNIILSDDTENNKLTTLLFYNFINEIFNIIFAFSPGFVTYLDSKAWKLLFKKQLTPIIFPFKNWEFLNFFSKNYLLKKKYKFKGNFLKKNILNNTKFFLFFYFFI